MRENKLKKIFSEGKAVVNGWLQIPSSFSAEVMAHQGWDSLTIDMQHGVIDYPHALQMLQAISTTDVVPMARVNWNAVTSFSPTRFDSNPSSISSESVVE